MDKKQMIYQQDGKRLVSLYPQDLPRLDTPPEGIGVKDSADLLVRDSPRQIPHHGHRHFDALSGERREPGTEFETLRRNG